MSRFIEMEFPELEAKVIAKLLGEMNVDVCNFLWENLPIESMLSQAILCEYLLVFQHGLELLNTKIKPHYKESLTEQKEGRILLNGEGILEIVWGPTPSEPLMRAPIAEVRQQDLPILKSVGRDSWEAFYWTKKPLKVVLRRSSFSGGI